MNEEHQERMLEFAMNTQPRDPDADSGLRHTGCGGIVTERPDEPPYAYCDEHGREFTTYVLRCGKCGKEIEGDPEITWEGADEV
jgi:hypothetical protein